MTPVGRVWSFWDALERFRTLFEQFWSGSVGSACSNEEQRTVFESLNDLTRFCMGSEQCRVGAVGRTPCNEEQRTGMDALDALERFRTLFEQVVAWCIETIACCRAL